MVLPERDDVLREAGIDLEVGFELASVDSPTAPVATRRAPGDVRNRTPPYNERRGDRSSLPIAIDVGFRERRSSYR